MVVGTAVRAARILVRGEAGPRPLSLGAGADAEPLLNSADTGWAGVPFELHRTEPVEAPAPAVPLPGEYHLRVVLQGAYEIELGAGRERLLRRGAPGSMSLHSGQGPRPLRVVGSTQTLVLRLNEPWLGRLFDGPPPGGIVPLAKGDPLARSLAHAMCVEVSGGAPTGALFAESLSLSLLSYAADKLPASRLRVGGALSAAQRRKLRRYVDEHLADRELSVTRLAELCGLGPRQFGGLFRQAFGVTPHRYVLARRIERAAELLGRDERELREVALATGFASQSHFTTAFREARGQTPARYAASRRRSG